MLLLGISDLGVGDWLPKATLYCEYHGNWPVLHTDICPQFWVWQQGRWLQVYIFEK